MPYRDNILNLAPTYRDNRTYSQTPNCKITTTTKPINFKLELYKKNTSKFYKIENNEHKAMLY